ncbi:MAG: hypothetical protein AAF573_21960 [Bacteroidota bacterium]
MRKIILFSALIGAMFFSVTSSAQNFAKAAGLRLGYPASVSYKQFINSSDALEFYVGTRGRRNSYRWISLSAAYQIHKPIESVEGLDYYFGAGLSAYFWNFDIETDASTASFGVQGYLGLSYTFEDAPINVSVDWIPTFLISGFDNGFGADYGSLAVRYILGGE